MSAPTMPGAGQGGVNQRGQIVMSAEEIEAFLARRNSMSVATINPDGTIHMVAMWYGFFPDGTIGFETKVKSQKVQNLRRGPGISVLVEDGETYETLRGVSLVGRAEIIEPGDELFGLGISVFERYMNVTYDESMKGGVEMMLNKRVGVKVHVDKTVSWDHRKLGIGR
jgi:PPOX class probable F420-dependent enzyme